MNKKYVKMKNGGIRFARNPLWVDGKMIANPTNEIYLANGYKPLERTEMPTKEGFYYTPKFVEGEEAIVQVWEEHVVLEDTEQGLIDLQN